MNNRQKLAELEVKIELQQMQIEANQMETEANTMELQELKNGQGVYFSVANYCALKGISPVPINWETVNTYPDSVLEELTW
jgi:hypothetical protein